MKDVLARGRRAAARADGRTKAAVLAGLAAAFVAGLVAGLEPGNPPSLALFVGRFHPLVVHFPVALILLAAGFELAAVLVRPLEPLRQAVPYVLSVGAAGAVVAVLAGYLLSLGGGYDEVLVDRHMWLGFGVASGAFLALGLNALLRRRPAEVLRRAYAGVLGLTAVSVIVTGHLGGSLTHGPGYLTHYMPAPLRQVVGMASLPGGRESAITNIDSARVYQDLVRPILERRCVECHGEGKAKGDLRLHTPEGLTAGGEEGPVFVVGEPDRSEIVRRITLPPGDDDAMPPEGASPLGIGETELIRWWIDSGASFDARVGDIEEAPTSVQTYLTRLVGPVEQRPTGLYALEAPPLDESALAALLETGLDVRRIAHDLELVQVSSVNVRGTLTDADLRALRPLARQITWLDLGRTGVTDAGLAVVGDMPNLTRLHLEQTAVTDAGLAHLAELAHLEYLNLYGTRVTDAGLEHLAALPALAALYLWQTDVTEAGLETLRRERPALRATLGAEFAPVDSSAVPAVSTSAE